MVVLQIADIPTLFLFWLFPDIVWKQFIFPSPLLLFHRGSVEAHTLKKAGKNVPIVSAIVDDNDAHILKFYRTIPPFHNVQKQAFSQGHVLQQVPLGAFSLFITIFSLLVSKCCFMRITAVITALVVQNIHNSENDAVRHLGSIRIREQQQEEAIDAFCFFIHSLWVLDR